MIPTVLPHPRIRPAQTCLTADSGSLTIWRLGHSNHFPYAPDCTNLWTAGLGKCQAYATFGQRGRNKRSRHCGGLTVCTDRPAESEQHNQHVFGEKGYVAGIPLSVKATQCGLRLRHTLQHRPHEFVAAALQELQDAVTKLKSAAAQEGVDDQLSAIFEDVLYHWALAEAYLHHPEMQTFMREKLGRKPSTRPLAAGDDGMLLASRVQLLQGPLYEGRYMIGSVRFTREPQQQQSRDATNRSASSAQASSSGIGLHWGGQADSFNGREIQPALEAVFGSERARAMTSVQGDALSRMDREGAARTYYTFVISGYFNRRMKQRMSDVGTAAGLSPLLSAVFAPAQPASDSSAGDAAVSGGDWSQHGQAQASQTRPEGRGEAPPVQSGYGEVAPVWRFFEQVPSSMTSPRTQQAASAAQRHLRALFGSSAECITTLQAWQQMCTEARWFGRALFDAEQLMVAASQKCERDLSMQSSS